MLHCFCEISLLILSVEVARISQSFGSLQLAFESAQSHWPALRPIACIQIDTDLKYSKTGFTCGYNPSIHIFTYNICSWNIPFLNDSKSDERKGAKRGQKTSKRESESGKKRDPQEPSS